MKVYLVLQESIIRDCDLPTPHSQCLGMLRSKAEAIEFLRKVYDEVKSKITQEDIFSWCSPDEDLEDVHIIQSEPDEPEIYWHIEEKTMACSAIGSDLMETDVI